MVTVISHWRFVGKTVEFVARRRDMKWRTNMQVQINSAGDVIVVALVDELQLRFVQAYKNCLPYDYSGRLLFARFNKTKDHREYRYAGGVLLTEPDIAPMIEILERANRYVNEPKEALGDYLAIFYDYPDGGVGNRGQLPLRSMFTDTGLCIQGWLSGCDPKHWFDSSDVVNFKACSLLMTWFRKDEYLLPPDKFQGNCLEGAGQEKIWFGAEYISKVLYMLKEIEPSWASVTDGEPFWEEIRRLCKLSMWSEEEHKIRVSRAGILTLRDLKRACSRTGVKLLD